MYEPEPVPEVPVHPEPETKCTYSTAGFKGKETGMCALENGKAPAEGLVKLNDGDYASEEM
jgi:hypothetical protein